MEKRALSYFQKSKTERTLHAVHFITKNYFTLSSLNFVYLYDSAFLQKYTTLIFFISMCFSPVVGEA